MTRCFVGAVAFLAFAYAAKADEPIKMGFFQHQPHQYVTDDGELRGASVSYFNMVSKQMGYSVEWVGPLSLARLQSMLKDGVLLDGTAHLLKNPVNGQYLYHGTVPYHMAQPVLVVRASEKLAELVSVRQLMGMRLWFHQSSSPSSFIKQNLAELRMLRVPASDDMWRQSVRALITGRTDGVHDLNAYSVLYAAKMMKQDRQVKVLNLPDKPLPVYVAFSKNNKRGKLLWNAYNAVQNKMRFAHKDYEKLLEIEFERLGSR